MNFEIIKDIWAWLPAKKLFAAIFFCIFIISISVKFIIIPLFEADVIKSKGIGIYKDNKIVRASMASSQ